VGANWDGCDPVRALAAAVGAVQALRPRPDAVLVSGDLAEHAEDGEYDQVRELLAPIDGPIYVLGGNHDDRAALRRHFDLPGVNGEPVQYTVELGPLRLVVLDTTRPGEDPGALDEERLTWLDAELKSAPEAPTVLAMHHPPLISGIPALDAIGLPAEDRRALAAVVERHPQVRRLVAGHMHRAITAVLAGRAVLAVPSTYMQSRLDFLAERLETAPEPAGFAVHVLLDGEVISHVQQVDQT
jgi:3',5'-cyclic-AMP phosphodiesterase